MRLGLIFLEFLSEMDLEVWAAGRFLLKEPFLAVWREESSRECPMRIAFDSQRRFDCPPVLEVRLDSVVSRQDHSQSSKGCSTFTVQPELRDELLDAVARDVNGPPVQTFGRPGMTYWSILVLGAVRLGCDSTTTRLQNLAEEHRSCGRSWGSAAGVNDRRCLAMPPGRRLLLSPDTIERVDRLIVAEGHRLVPEAAATVRGDWFVPATNSRYPTDSGLMAMAYARSCRWRCASRGFSVSAVGGGENACFGP